MPCKRNSNHGEIRVLVPRYHPLEKDFIIQERYVRGRCPLDTFRLRLINLVGDIVKEKDVTVTKKTGAAQDEVKYKEKKLQYEEKIETVQKKLNAAERDVDRAQAEVDRLRYAPLIPEPSVLDEIDRVRRSIPMRAPPVKGQVHVTTEINLSPANHTIRRPRDGMGH